MTAIEDPFSANAVITPEVAVASADVAPPETPVPSANVAADGATVSSVKPPPVATVAEFPAASVAVILAATAP
ncbi:MAG: hypothetical protein EBZ75_15445 [Oxalobacteraceae bacterium]|nr:hypothetical protein [Oxalobacteraceae bacterium]